jgi:small-conductance mechanosensitive channel
MEFVRALFADHLTPPVAWPVALGVAVAVVGALEVVYRFLFRWLSRLTEATTTHLDDVLVKRMRLPAQVLVFLVGANVLFALREIENAVLSHAVSIVELMLVAYLLIEAAETALIDYWLGERKKVSVPPVVRGLGLLILYTVAALSVVGSVTGVNVAPVLATSTVVTVVLGLALQDTLGNLFAGLALSLEKSFAVGDWLLVDGVEGRVVSMGWRTVQMQTFTLDIVSLPNAVFAKARVQNFTRPEPLTGRNVDVLVAVEAAPADVEAAAKAAFAEVPAVRETPATKVWFVAMSAVGQRYVLRIYLDDFGRHDDAESDVRKAFHRACLARGIAPRAAPVAVADA